MDFGSDYENIEYDSEVIWPNTINGLGMMEVILNPMAGSFGKIKGFVNKIVQWCHNILEGMSKYITCIQLLLIS